MIEKAEMKDRLKEAMKIREKKAVDLSRDLKIPKSAISQYLSGTRTPQDSLRTFAIAEYLDVDEAWLMGYNVPMERNAHKKRHSDYVATVSDNQKILIEFAKSVPEDKAALVLRVIKSILEGSE